MEQIKMEQLKTLKSQINQWVFKQEKLSSFAVFLEEWNGLWASANFKNPALIYRSDELENAQFLGVSPFEIPKSWFEYRNPFSVQKGLGKTWKFLPKVQNWPNILYNSVFPIKVNGGVFFWLFESEQTLIWAEHPKMRSQWQEVFLSVSLKLSGLIFSQKWLEAAFLQQQKSQIQNLKVQLIHLSQMQLMQNFIEWPLVLTQLETQVQNLLDNFENDTLNVQSVFWPEFWKNLERFYPEIPSLATISKDLPLVNVSLNPQKSWMCLEKILTSKSKIVGLFVLNSYLHLQIEQEISSEGAVWIKNTLLRQNALFAREGHKITLAWKVVL